jgi:hypothetical protein
VLVLAVEVVAGFLEERKESREVVNAQAAIGFDQLVQRWRGSVDRLEIFLSLRIADSN